MLPELAQARLEFLALVAAVRPELHRYCSRLTGSIVDGEDIVQDALARAFYALGMTTDIPPLRPWLFRIAHNAAIDHLRRRQHEPVAAEPDDALADDSADPAATRAALGAFVALPVRQRSAVILKDVLGLSLEDIAEAIDATVPAVKAALVRGRAALRAQADVAADPARPAPPITDDDRALLGRYVALFNARDWPGLQQLLADDARLDLVGQVRRDGRAVGEYYGRYRDVPVVRAEVGLVDGRPAMLMFDPPAAPRPSYVVLLTWRAGRVTLIRDYRYARYVADELWAVVGGSPGATRS